MKRRPYHTKSIQMMSNSEIHRSFEAVSQHSPTLMSRICRNVGDSRKLRLFELDHESKMRLLKTHSHTSKCLAIEAGTREEKLFKKSQSHNKAKVTHQKHGGILSIAYADSLAQQSSTEFRRSLNSSCIHRRDKTKPPLESKLQGALAQQRTISELL